jgi:hypothetical protein
VPDTRRPRNCVIAFWKEVSEPSTWIIVRSTSTVLSGAKAIGALVMRRFPAALRCSLSAYASAVLPSAMTRFGCGLRFETERTLKEAELLKIA